MKRKRNNLDTAEANYLYAQVLVGLNKYVKFKNLSIPERNNFIDDICFKCIDNVSIDDDTKEALKFEIKSYRLSENEKKKYYDNSMYENNLTKPDDFNERMKIKYKDVIDKNIKRFMKSQK